MRPWPALVAFFVFVALSSFLASVTGWLWFEVHALWLSAATVVAAMVAWGGSLVFLMLAVGDRL